MGAGVHTCNDAIALAASAQTDCGGISLPTGHFPKAFLSRN